MGRGEQIWGVIESVGTASNRKRINGDRHRLAAQDELLRSAAVAPWHQHLQQLVSIRGNGVGALGGLDLIALPIGTEAIREP